MKKLEHIYFEDKESLRKWLKINHDKSPGVWMVFYKKASNKKCISYREALEEALCFGWIDSTVKGVDDEQYLRKFTPRINSSNWSDVNKKIVSVLINEGRMTEAGLRKIDVYVKTGKLKWDNKREQRSKEDKVFEIPEFILKEFSINEPALSNFNNLALSYKKIYVGWITSAKRDETIQKRLQESIVLLKENKKLGLK